MKTQIACSSNSEVTGAVKELKERLDDNSAKLILYFVSSCYNQNQIVLEMSKTFSNAQIVGCSTAGELISGKMMKNSVVAMAFGEELIEEFEIAVINDINNIRDAGLKFEKKFNKKLRDLDYEKYFGIVLIDGLSGMEEKIMDELGNLTDIIFMGGSAGDDLKFKSTFLFNNNEVIQNGAVVIIIKSKVKFGFIKTQSFKVLDKMLIPTKVDEKNREVIEFNYQPAAEYYAELVGAEKENIEKYFMTNPIGLVIENDPYVRSPQKVNGNAIKFYCNIKEGISLNLLQSTDIINDTIKAINEYVKKNGQISALINFNCILRTLELESKNQTVNYGKIFSSIPMIGFSTYGEQFIGHINHTAVMFAFE